MVVGEAMRAVGASVGEANNGVWEDFSHPPASYSETVEYGYYHGHRLVLSTVGGVTGK